MSQNTITRTIKLNNGTEMPQFGLGVWKATPEETINAVTSALVAGYRHIDTAWIYGNEAAVGEAIRQSGLDRDEIFVTTKLWRDHHGEPLKAFDESLARLGLKVVDLYLSHFPATGTRIEGYRGMEMLLDQGKCRAIGVSNYTVDHLEELLRETTIVPAVNQVEMHPFLVQEELIDYCNDKGIVIEAYSPLAHAKRFDDPTLQELATKYNKSPAQIMIRWGLDHGFVVIPKSVNEHRIVENASVFDFKLTPEELTQLDGLNENFRTCWDPTGVP